MYENETTLTDALYGRVEEAFKHKENITTLFKYISRYMDKWSDVLLSTDLSTRLLFSESDKNIIYQVTGIKADEVKSIIKSSKTIKSSWMIATNPFYILMILIMRYFAKNNMEQELIGASMYISYLIYTTSHKGSFPHLPSKEIIDYTINNLSNRYILKQEGTIQGMLEHTVRNALVGRYKEELLRGYDKDITDLLYGIEVRISSNVKNIAELFYENHKNGKYMFKESDVSTEDEYHVSDNISFKINKVAGIVSLSIITEGFDRKSSIGRAVSLNPGTSEKKLVAMLNTIVEEDRKSINELISDILTLFVYKGSGNKIEEVRSMKFISETLQLYKSNAQDDVTTRIKAKLLEWINLTSQKYGRNFISKGKTSLDTYRRAIYTAFIFKIMESVKG